MSQRVWMRWRREEGRTASELVTEALLRCIEEREWAGHLRYGEEKARTRGIAPEDVERLIDGYRSEATPRARGS